MTDENTRPAIALSEDARVIDYIARLEQANADLLSQGLGERTRHESAERMWRRMCVALTVLVMIGSLEPLWSRLTLQ